MELISIIGVYFYNSGSFVETPLLWKRNIISNKYICRNYHNIVEEYTETESKEITQTEH